MPVPRRDALVAVLLVTAAACAGRRATRGMPTGAGARPTPVSAEGDGAAVVAALEEAVVRASAAGDVAALDTLLDSTFVGTVRNGRSFGRRATIARWTRPDTTGERSVIGPLALRPFDGGAFVELTDTQHARDGRPLRASRVVDLWVKGDAGWRLVAGHSLPGTAPADAAPDSAVRLARGRWNALLAARDTAALRGLVTDSVAQTSPAFRRVGGDAYLTLIGRLLARRPDLAMRFEPTRVEAGPDAAFETGRWTEGWRERGEPTALAGEYHAVWRREAGGWKIAAEMFAPTSCTGPTYCTH